MPADIKITKVAVTSKPCRNCKKRFTYYTVKVNRHVSRTYYSKFFHFSFEKALCKSSEMPKHGWDEPGRYFCSSKCHNNLIEYRKANGLDDRSNDWRSKRRMMIERDNHRCQSCGSENRLHVDHIKPFIECKNREEADDPSNLMTLCYNCHLRKTMEHNHSKPQEQICELI